MVLDQIAGQFWYVSLMRLVEWTPGRPYWNVTAVLRRDRVLDGTATTPDEALYRAVLCILSASEFESPSAEAQRLLLLNDVADKLYFLVLKRPRFLLPAIPMLWTATALLAGGREVSVSGGLPDATLLQLALFLA